MQAGEDGAVDEKGELLPVLSKSATRMKYDKLIKKPHSPNFQETCQDLTFGPILLTFC